MSRADLLYRETCARILREGVWDTDQSVRPRWADGTPGPYGQVLRCGEPL